MATDPLPTLIAALDQGRVPPSLTARAQAAIDDSGKPLGVALLGWQGAGKTALLQMLAGSTLWPQGQRLPTLQLRHGASAQAICTSADGRKTRVDPSDITAMIAQNPIFVDLQLPLPSLATLSLLDVASPADPADMAKACHWAAARSDVLLWVGRDCDSATQMLWAGLPDRIKDNAFFVLTHLQDLRDHGLLDARLAQIQAAVGGDFQQVMPIDSPAALLAQQTQPAALAATGGLALIAALRDRMDQRHRAAQAVAGAILARCAPVPAPIQAAAPEPAAQPDRPAAAPQELCQKALAHIQAQSRDLAQASPAQIITQVAQQLYFVSAILDDATDPALAPMRAAAYDAADLAQLLVIEKRDQVAEDALCLLAQITQDLQAVARLP